MFEVLVEGFPPWACEAETRAKARYACYLAFTEGWTDVTFLEFLGMSKVRRVRVKLV